MRFVLVILLSLMSYAVHAVTESVIGKVTKVEFHLADFTNLNENQQALALISVEGVPLSCNGSQRRVAIAASHPLYKSIVSAALFARISNINVKVHYGKDSCTVRHDALDLQVFTLL